MITIDQCVLYDFVLGMSTDSQKKIINKYKCAKQNIGL